LIVPCGLEGRGATSLAVLLKEKAPSMERVKEVVVEKMTGAFRG